MSWRNVSRKGSPLSSRLTSRSCVGPPSRNRAVRRASSGVIPRRMFSDASSSRCSSSSCVNSWSTRRIENHPRTRDTRVFNCASIASPSLRDSQHSANHSRDALPVPCFGGELLPPGPCDRIKFCLAIVFRSSPSGTDPALLQQPDQRSINSSLIELQHFFADLLDPPGDPVAVQRPHHLKSFEDHQIKRALQNFRLALGHEYSCGVATGVFHSPCGMSTGKPTAPNSSA